MTGCPKTITIR